MSRSLPVGAELAGGEGTHFRVWAPESPTAGIELYPENGGAATIVPLAAEPGGYFSGLARDIHEGARYRIKLAHGAFPDPASRFQPEGPHGPSQVVNPAFAWTDGAWHGRPPREAVIYELHVGTFTPEGTWRAAEAQLAELARAGITMIEVMPIADFPGRFGWGYDGVNLFAPTRLYGSPADVRSFVNRAHAERLMVILDVVYNHIGPDGNYLPQFAKQYFSTKYECEWGDPINFDGEGSGPVREFFRSNARYWIEEFHFDGLRLDATQQIFDATRPHVIAEVAMAARAAGRGRTIFMVAENEPQDSSLLRSIAEGGCGLDAMWNDDFHHAAMVAATGRAEAYYRDYRGTAQELVSAVKYGFLYQGQRSGWQQNRRGTPAFDFAPERFAAFLQNHDQIANSLRGWRLHQLTSPGRYRALTALLLLSPQIPMLFQGQEFAASAPFLYFADHEPELSRRVAEGRRQFLSQFPSVMAPESLAELAPPDDVRAFERAKLEFAERSRHRAAYQLHQDLLRRRREDASVHRPARLDGAVLGPAVFVLRYFSASGDDRLLIVNLGTDLHLDPAPEPLLAPTAGHGWRVLWSSEAPVYGGGGTAPLETTANWIIPAESAVLMGPHEHDELPGARLSQND